MGGGGGGRVRHHPVFQLRDKYGAEGNSEFSSSSSGWQMDFRERDGKREREKTKKNVEGENFNVY